MSMGWKNGPGERVSPKGTSGDEYVVLGVGCPSFIFFFVYFPSPRSEKGAKPPACWFFFFKFTSGVGVKKSATSSDCFFSGQHRLALWARQYGPLWPDGTKIYITTGLGVTGPGPDPPMVKMRFFFCFRNKCKTGEAIFFLATEKPRSGVGAPGNCRGERMRGWLW